MVARNEAVLERVRQELSKNPTMGSRELYGMAQELETSIGQDTLQQFHARYVLPIKREQARARGGSSPRRPRQRRAKSAERSGTATAARPGRNAVSVQATADDRDLIRSVLLEFARDFADAESRPEIVQVLSRIDEYVAKIAANRKD